MGLFRTSSLVRSSENASAVALLRLQVATLEAQVQEKDALIGELHQQGNVMLDVSVSGKSVGTVSTVQSQGSVSTPADSSATQRLSEQLESCNMELETVKLQLEEQRAMTAHLRSKLQTSQDSNASLKSQIQHLQQALGDQKTQLDCLQTLNETNTDIVSQMESRAPPQLEQLTAGANGRRRRHSSCGPQENNQWKLYGKLQALMETNNQLAHQVGALTQEKQMALQQVAQEQHKVGQLQKQVATLSSRDQEQQVENQATLLQQVLPEIQGVLDMFGQDLSLVETESDPKLLQLSLQVCLAQLKQAKREHDMQMQKTLKQSMALADSQATVDTLSGKLDHYERLMESVLKANKNKLAAVMESDSSMRGDESMRASTTGFLDSSNSRRFSKTAVSRSNSSSKRSVFGFFSSSTARKVQQQEAVQPILPKTPSSPEPMVDPTEFMSEHSENSIGGADDLFRLNTVQSTDEASC
ncbi:expressed unknown protein [Seminavis robusta]|uniref:Uncharacterized protein n=1 Tax=Seminavis robusta TaxID=568900 RepID=A0A9N8EC81_9STRA|nr:expressed unknown protein [Seminavis robusta]|eukprot:Sro790_g202830.1 n/a (471) ;mRNA; r:30496-31908